MDLTHTLALTLGVAWASGINLYAAVLMLGLLGTTGHIALPVQLETLSNPWVLGAAGFMFLAEFLADKIPGFDSLWDAVHTFIRIPAGAALAAGAVGPMDPAIQAAAVLLGGAVATGAHGTKMATRLLINGSPEPFSNWSASVAEDTAVFGGLYFALHYPLVFLCFLLVFLAMAVWLMPKLIRALRGGVMRIKAAFR